SAEAASPTQLSASLVPGAGEAVGDAASAEGTWRRLPLALYLTLPLSSLSASSSSSSSPSSSRRAARHISQGEDGWMDGERRTSSHRDDGVGVRMAGQVTVAVCVSGSEGASRRSSCSRSLGQQLISS